LARTKVTLPARRHAALLRELSLLDRDTERIFIYSEDLALARVGDPQGVGGAWKMKH
jgi:hypothetical protein